jgi:hypothetical protein
VEEDGPVADDESAEEEPDGVAQHRLPDESSFDGSHPDAGESSRHADGNETLHDHLLAHLPTYSYRLLMARW